MSECVRINFFFHLIYNFEQVLTVLVLQHRLSNLAHTLFCNPSVTIGNALQASNFQALALLNDFHKGTCLSQAVVRAGIEPSEATSKDLYFQFAIFQDQRIRGTVLLTHFHFTIYSLYNTVTDTRKP